MSVESVQILLVEDNPDDVELTLHAFAKQNLSSRIEVVSDGEQALDYLFCRGAFASRSFEQPPKVVLLDLKLPKVDGLEVLREMKRDKRTRLIPVVAVTTSKEESDIVESYGLGVNSYIVKPVDFEQFTDAVQAIGMYWLLLNQEPPVP